MLAGTAGYVQEAAATALLRRIDQQANSIRLSGIVLEAIDQIVERCRPGEHGWANDARSHLLGALGSVALASKELLDLRYSAFTSLERAGLTPESVNLLRQLSADEMLGRSAHSALARWHLDPRD